MPKMKFDVAIAGGSFAGLAVARGLVQALGSDVRLAVVDRANPSAHVVADSRAFAIWAGTKKIPRRSRRMGFRSAPTPRPSLRSRFRIRTSTMLSGRRGSPTVRRRAMDRLRLTSYRPRRLLRPYTGRWRTIRRLLGSLRRKSRAWSLASTQVTSALAMERR